MNNIQSSTDDRTELEKPPLMSSTPKVRHYGKIVIWNCQQKLNTKLRKFMNLIAQIGQRKDIQERNAFSWCCNIAQYI